jgi:hypothetical protein
VRRDELRRRISSLAAYREGFERQAARHERVTAPVEGYRPGVRAELAAIRDRVIGSRR